MQDAVERTRCCLLELQRDDGHWVGELQGDTILESEFILLLAFLGRERDARVTKAARYVLRQQTDDGGWSNYPGGPVELSVSVKAYFALKLAGHPAEAPYMRRAREVIRALGGAAGCNSFTKFYLALLGQFPYDNCPAVAPEMLFLPRWAAINIYAMSSWTRTIVVPLSIFYAHKPVRHLPPELGIAELFLLPPDTAQLPHPPTRRWLSWTNFFLVVDQTIKLMEKWGPRRIRGAALKKAERWLLEHFADSDGVGAIFPPIIYTVVSLRCLGYPDESPEMQWALKQLDNLIIEDEDTIRLQPCFSPVWDTALTLNALSDAGIPGNHPAVRRAVAWLWDKEVRRPGDWSVRNPGLEPAGWFFEYRNGFYPDTDDTAMVLMALTRTGHAFDEAGSDRPARNRENGSERNGDGSKWRNVDGENGRSKHSGLDSLPFPLSRDFHPAVRRAVNWLMAMQNPDGGWAAFDREITRDVLTKVPFADHNAMLDPSCPDITARVLEALGGLGFRVGHPQVDRALLFLQKTQEREGCWLGRWGVNYVYGSWQVLVGLKAVDFDMDLPMARRTVAWLQKVQQAGGGWGESCRSYDDPSLKGQGTPTASQTAWALLGLMAASETGSAAVEAGIDYLLATQEPDGTWREDEFTGTGFPKVFYLKYHMYCLYFPLMALARFARAKRAERQRQRETSSKYEHRKAKSVSRKLMGQSQADPL